MRADITTLTDLIEGEDFDEATHGEWMAKLDDPEGFDEVGEYFYGPMWCPFVKPV